MPTIKIKASKIKIIEGETVTLEVPSTYADLNKYSFQWDCQNKGDFDPDDKSPQVKWHSAGLNPGTYPIKVTITPHIKGAKEKTGEVNISVAASPVALVGTVPVSMQRSGIQPTSDQILWVVIRNSASAISFEKYHEFITQYMCADNLPHGHGELSGKPLRGTPFPFIDAYERLKVATELFLMVNCGVHIDFSQLTQQLLDKNKNLLEEESERLERIVTEAELDTWWNSYRQAVNGTQTIPYLELIKKERLGDLPLKDMDAKECYGVLAKKLSHPCLLELIWSYWMEEGMLVQSMNAISLRFQNKRVRGGRDPLAHLDIDPLRPLNSILWGFLRDEQHRLSLTQRVYEYDHHYGMRLFGRAVPRVRPVDSRSKFLEGFHNLLYLCSIFYKEDDDNTVTADGFPVLRGLKDVHLLLAEGAHNQFGDLPSTARMEMLMQQWLLARPEMREFLGSRIMVPYQEGWMDRVDTMKKLQGWTDTTIIHFRDLAIFGEQILLSIRYGSWNTINDPNSAGNWARYWRPEIQGYIHAYRAVTGVDLTIEASDPRQAAARNLPPSVHLRNRLAMQLRSG